MSYAALTPETRAIAESVLTRKQLDVFKLRENHQSWRIIGDMLGIHEATARGHYRSAIKALAPHLRKDAA